jgi:hypothetical protein
VQDSGGIIEHQAIQRGTFTSVRDLMDKLRAFSTGWNRRNHPFIWTKTPDQILDSVNRKPEQPHRQATSMSMWSSMTDGSGLARSRQP